MKTMGAAKFKAHFLAVIAEVQAKREPVLVTKHGKPVAKMVPLDLPEGEDPLDAFHFPGVTIAGDVMSPIYSDEEYEEFYQRSVEQLHDTSR